MTTSAATGATTSTFGNIGRLALAQALGGANANVVYATGAIVGSQLAPDPSLVTFPISLFVVGMACGTLPTGYISRRYGRRAAFLIGTTLGVVAGMIGLAAVLRASFALFCLATFVAGFYSAVVQSFRFAATDGAAPSLRARAISWVMVGGLVGGVIGPQMIQVTMDLWPPYLFAASFIGQSAFALASMAVLAGVSLPRPAASEIASGRPLLEIVATPKFAIAALCGVVSYALMNLVMTSAPLAMRLCGLSLSDSNLGIQWHVLAMFGPSFFTGGLIARFGAGRIVGVGMLLTCAAAIVDLSGLTVWHFWTGLVLLGLGWNFGFVGASAMVVETHRPEERNKVQSFNDFVIFGTMALGSFSSGKLLTSFGWDAVNWVAFPPIAIALTALLGVGLLRGRVAA
jgi:MFS family permease